MVATQFEIEFRKDGTVHDENAVTALLDGLAGVTDLLVLAHGWNNDMADARNLYDHLVNSIDAVAPNVPGIAGRQLGVVRVFWPSKKFAESDLIPGGGAASAATENDAALIRALEELKHDPMRLGGTDVDAARAANVDRAIELVGQLDASFEAQQEFVLRIRAVLNPDEAHPDDGSREFFEREPDVLFDRFREPIPVTLEAGHGGAASLDEGGAAFFGDLLEGAQAAARRIANFATYYQMKTRAGTVGQNGLAPLLVRVRDRRPDLPLHLVGHSFGGRLVTAASARLPANTDRVTMTLLQAAFSHNGLSRQFDTQNDGAFRTVFDDQRISGPILITHTKNDLAVGIAYPLASRIALDQAAALGDADDPYGGMGRNGAQHTPEVSVAETELRDDASDSSYTFTRGSVFNLVADRFIADHGAVTGRQVANALLHAVAVE